MIKTITIIGSRKTPTEILEFMHKIAKYCSIKGIIVRSGKAGGADAAAIYGCMEADKEGRCNAIPEMFVPWSGFGEPSMTNKWDSAQGHNHEAQLMAEDIHPAWNRCSQGAKKLHTRNVCQILGEQLNSPADVVLYWCTENLGQPTGGTATAVNLGKKHGCKTINMLHSSWKDLLRPLIGLE